MPSQFNNLIQSKSIATITPQQILDAGEPVFFDVMTSADIASINRLIQSYSRIHAPTYGQPIPQSGLVSSLVGVGELLVATINEIRTVLAVSITNAGGAAPIIGTLTLGGMFIANYAADPSSTTAIPLPAGIFSSRHLPIAVTVTSGTASDLTTDVASLLVVQ